MTSIVNLEIEERQLGSIIRRITIIHGTGQAEPVTMFHESTVLKPLRPSDPLDGHLLPILLYLMKVGKPVHVRGALSREMLRNIDELQLIWSRWRPSVYKKINIEAESILDDRKPASDKAIAAFSGGVDATFTALRHSNVTTSAVRHELTDVLMVHGFDVNLDASGFFDSLTHRVAPLLNSLGLRLRVIRTNSKELSLQHWEDSFALELGGCLHMFASEFGYGLVGSSEPYDALVLPWGSSPVTDHLMSGASMRIVHDGAGFSRTDKVAEIAQHAIACSTLKVCWQGADQSGNCGVCEKCVRTKLNFLATGHSIPESLPYGFNIADIARIRLQNLAQVAELKSIQQFAEVHETDGPWLPALRTRIAKGVNKDRTSPGRVFVKQALRSVGLEDTARSFARAVFPGRSK